MKKFRHFLFVFVLFIQFTPAHAQWFNDTFGTGTFNTAAPNPLISGATATGITHNGISSTGTAWYHSSNPISAPQVSYGNDGTSAAFTLTESLTVQSGTTGTVSITSLSVDVRRNTAGSTTFASCKINGVSYPVSTSTVTTAFTTTTIAVSPALTFSANNNISIAMEFTGGTGTNQMRIDNFKIFGTNGVSLPITLNSFSGYNTPDNNLLQWQTASESQNKGFDIEASKDGVRFEKIGFVAGNGTTNTRQDYSFKDEGHSGVTYYRLKQLDFDGGFEYSKIISIVRKDEKTVSVFPNPSAGVFTITGMEDMEGETFTLMNIMGQTTSINIQNTGQFDMSAYPSGMYYLRVERSGQVLKLMKE